MNTNNAIEIRGLVKNYPSFTLGPLDLSEAQRGSPVVLDRNDRLLRAFTMADGRWRLPATHDDVDPRFVATGADDVGAGALASPRVPDGAPQASAPPSPRATAKNARIMATTIEPPGPGATGWVKERPPSRRRP